MKIFLASLLIALAASAAFAENKALAPLGDGSAERPYLINCLENLVWMRENVASSEGKY